MSLTILNNKSIGGQLGEELGAGLRLLAEHKLNQLNKRNESEAAAKAYESAGISPDTAKLIANASPEDRKVIFKQLSETNLVNNVLNNLIGNQPQQGFQQSQIQQEQPNQQVAPQDNTLKSIQDLITTGSPEVKKVLRGAAPLAIPNEPVIEPKNITQQVEKTIPEGSNLKGLGPTIKRMIEEGYPVPTNQKALTELIKLAHTENIEEKKIAREEKREALKDLKDIRTQAYDEEKIADDRLEDLSRLKELQAEGFNNPSTIESLKNLGLDIPAFLSDPTQEAQKIVALFTRDIGKSFKGAISKYDLEQFAAGIPNLLQSPEGFKRVVAGYEKMYRIQSEYGKNVRKVIQENPGIYQEDLYDLVNAKMVPIRKKIREQFLKDLERPVPEAENTWLAALKIGGSSVLGSIGSLAKKAGPAAIGGAIGSVVPGIGTATGALAGHTLFGGK